MTDRTGQHFGNYTLLNPIGAGGMGEVYLAQHRTLGKKYAVKILPATLASNPEFVDRFTDEARVMAELNHRNIVRVYDAGRSSDGVFYIAMEYVPGPEGTPRNLHDQLATTPDGRLPEKAALAIALHITDALAYAHKQGVVHRDIKPGNILIAADGRSMLTDFGLAKVVDGTLRKAMVHATLTPPKVESLRPERRPGDDSLDVAATLVPNSKPKSSAHSALGTYDYMAPEQREGGDIGPPTDVYAMGMLMYRILTGRRPVGRFKPPSVAVPGLSKRWDAIVDRCIAAEPGGRYPSGSELLTDLRKVRGASRGPLKLAAAVVLLLILGSVGILLVATLRQQPAEESALVQERPRRRKNPSRRPRRRHDLCRQVWVFPLWLNRKSRKCRSPL